MHNLSRLLSWNGAERTQVACLYVDGNGVKQKQSQQGSAKCGKLSAYITRPQLPEHITATEDAHVEVGRALTCACVRSEWDPFECFFVSMTNWTICASTAHPGSSERAHYGFVTPNPLPELFLPFYLCSTEALVPKLHSIRFLVNGQNSGTKPWSPELLSCMLRSPEEIWCITALVKTWA